MFDIRKLFILCNTDDCCESVVNIYLCGCQALILTLYACDIRIHSLFQTIMKKLFYLESSKNSLVQGNPTSVFGFLNL